VWNNTQKLVVARDQSRKGKNKMLLWANVYAAKSRVPCDLKTQAATLEAYDIPLTAFLPCSDDYSALHDRMAVIVSRIIVSHVPFFNQHWASAVKQMTRLSTRLKFCQTSGTCYTRRFLGSPMMAVLYFMFFQFCG